MAQDSMDQYRSIAAFDAVEMGELSVIDGEVVTVIEKNTSGKIMYSQKSTGLLPCMMSLSRYIYCCKLSTSFIKLDCQFFLPTRLMQRVSTTCGKSANIKFVSSLVFTCN